MADATIQRTFVNWNQPLVRAVVDHLVAHHPDLDFSDVMLVLSGGRVGRRIMSLLADEADRRRVAMIPPELPTPGALPERLHRPPCPKAESLARRVAWARALQQNEAATRRIFPRVAAGADLTALYSPAMLMEQCHQELSGGCTSFDAVAARDWGVDGESRAARWNAAATIYQSYLRELDAMKLCDIQHARNSAIAAGAITAPKQVILAGIVQLNEQTRCMLAAVADRVETLIYAPPELANDFDEFGCVKTAGWLDRALDLEGADIRIVPGASDQAAEAFAAIAARGEVPADQITIGVTDDSLVAHLEAEAENLIDVPVRYGPGKSVAETRPYHVLAVAADYVESGAFREFARLVRHPDIEDWLHRCHKNDASTWRDWRTLLDDYACEHLPDRIGDAQRTPEGWRRAEDLDEAFDDRPHLAWLYGCIEDFVSPLRDHPNAARPPDQWAPLILALLSRCYGQQQFDLNDECDRLVARSCQKLRECLDELHELSAPQARMTAAEAIRAVLSLAASCNVPPPLTGQEIEIVGWLELMPDDADHLIITGFNDGRVPDSAGAGPFLTNDLRQKLKLVTDDDRCARDAYLLSAMLASRPPGHVTLISGRVSADNDPMLPSRLLFACDRRVLAERVLRVIDDKKRPPRVPLVYRFGAGDASKFLKGAVVPPPGAIKPITSMRVTSFRDYLASPQFFYLRHMLKLETIEETAPRELDARQCGSLVHTTLKAFADSHASASTSRDQCVDVFRSTFDALADARFGVAPPAALRFQLELIKKRLDILGVWQADWAKDGWRIHRSEWKSDQQPALHVDGLPMILRGQIDRIDFNADHKEWAVLDYKLGAKKTPASTHLRAGEWRDLQLPLYRHLAREFIQDATVRLGYVVIADSAEHIGLAQAEWDDAMLASADEAAAEVVRAVRRFDFKDIGDDPSTDGIFAFIFGQDLIDEEAREQGVEQ